MCTIKRETCILEQEKELDVHDKERNVYIRAEKSARCACLGEKTFILEQKKELDVHDKERNVYIRAGKRARCAR